MASSLPSATDTSRLADPTSHSCRWRPNLGENLVSVVWFVRLWSLVDWFVGRMDVEIWWTVSLVDWFVDAGLARRCV